MYSAKDGNEIILNLDQARDGLMSATAGLSDAQSNFKPSPTSWSIAEIVEHLAAVEDRIFGRVSQMLAAPPEAAPGGKFQDSDAALIAKLRDRSTKFQAPEPAQPTGKPFSNSLERLAANRPKLAELLQSAPADFRQRTMPHPVFGPLDAHQWLLALAGHCGRHTQQIIETKAHPNFPAS
jgi:uncharacterized damage-inducible protein DinB